MASGTPCCSPAMVFIGPGTPVTEAVATILIGVPVWQPNMVDHEFHVALREEQQSGPL